MPQNARRYIFRRQSKHCIDFLVGCTHTEVFDAEEEPIRPDQCIPALPYAGFNADTELAIAKKLLPVLFRLCREQLKAWD